MRIVASIASAQDSIRSAMTQFHAVMAGSARRITSDSCVGPSVCRTFHRVTGQARSLSCRKCRRGKDQLLPAAAAVAAIR